MKVGDQAVCIRDGSDAPNPWHAANPLTLRKQYTILRVVRNVHADGRVMPDLYAVDKSGRLWGGENFRHIDLRFTGLDFV